MPAKHQPFAANDDNYDRPLSEHELTSLHHAWLNDVGAWMTTGARCSRDVLLSAAVEMQTHKGAGKGKESTSLRRYWQQKTAAQAKALLENKPWKKAASGENREGPHQEAHQVTRQLFNKYIKDMGVHKNTLMKLIQYQNYNTVEGMKRLLDELHWYWNEGERDQR